MTRRFEPLAGVIASVEIDEDGFALIEVAHPACGARGAYASGPFEDEPQPLSCSKCGEPLLVRLGEGANGEGAYEVADASAL